MKLKQISILSVLMLIMLVSTKTTLSLTYKTTPNLDAINISGAWDISQGSEDVVIAVIDTGIVLNKGLPSSILWTNQAELNGQTGVDDDHNGFVDDIHGWDFVDQDSDPFTENDGFDLHPHGTIVSSVLSSPHDAEPYGIAPGVKIMNLRSNDVIGAGSFLNVFDAVEYAVKNGADLISMSLGYELQIPGGEITELRDATNADIPVIVSAGNDPKTISDLANDRNTIAISSIDNNQEISTFSSRGDAVDFTAPGEYIPSLLPDGNLTYTFGTSLSAPHVTGVMALMLSLRSDIPSKYLYGVLAFTATDLGATGKDQLYGYGLIDATAALLAWKNFEKIDFDKDGSTSGDELKAGSDPFDAQSHPPKTITVKRSLPVLGPITFGIVMLSYQSFRKFKGNISC